MTKDEGVRMKGEVELSGWDKSAKYRYSEDSTIHNPLEIGEDLHIHTWTLELSGKEYRVTREVYEAYRAQLAAAAQERDALRRKLTNLILELNEHHTIRDLHRDVIEAIWAGNMVLDARLLASADGMQGNKV